MTDNTVYRTMLLDFYGELLTDKQREYFDLHYNEDLSLSEIAEQGGISRQGVWDIIRRAEAVLRDTEEKTGLVERFSRQREKVSDIENQLTELIGMTDGQAKLLAENIKAGLQELKG